MSIVNSIETVRDWLTTEVCPLVKLKLPDDNATDASYPYKLVNPTAFSLFVPSKDRTPPKVAAPIPSVCVQIVQGNDDLTMSARGASRSGSASLRGIPATTGPTSSNRKATAAAPTSSGNTTRRRPPLREETARAGATHGILWTRPSA